MKPNDQAINVPSEGSTEELSARNALCPLHPFPRLLCQVQCIVCGAVCGEHQLENFHCQNFVSTSKALRRRLLQEWNQRDVSLK